MAEIKEKNIFKRIVFDEIAQYLLDDGIIVFHGARQVGKTYLMLYAENYLKSKGETTLFIDLEDQRNLEILDAGYQNFLSLLSEKFDLSLFSHKKKLFVFIDEIQYLKNPSSFMKLVADHHKEVKLIVSGSSSFDIKNKFKNSLVGRTINFEIFPLSFWEFLTFKNYRAVPGKIFTSIKTDEMSDLFKEYALFGGYPEIVLTKTREKKEKKLAQIIDTYLRKDIKDLAEIKEIDKFNGLLKILAAQSGNLLNVLELSNTAGLSKQTVERYLFLLENTYIIKLVRPYSRNIRSELFKTAKIYFYDTGLMQILWLKSLQKEIIGNVFETSIFSELVKKYGRENINYWRTKDRKEIDFILSVKNDLLPIEAKVNFGQFNKTAVNYFISHYKLKNYKIVGLKGILKNEHYIYPWDL
ncbi:MAG: ATP-binding protein [bacterium]|nr:ATP-binding protein [bacterium]